MAKTAIFGLASGVAVVILTLIIVAVVNVPQASDAAASGGVAPCGIVAADQGYGLVRPARREACPAAVDRG